ncbi:MAG: membrane protein insertion efficiency factor YidD [Thermodesulfobacteriota bacterium]
MIKSLIVRLIRIYKRLVSPFLPPSCRFHPSCSDYAAGAVETHGTLRGSLLAGKRLSRCHPFNDGGYDPVPPTPKKEKE